MNTLKTGLTGLFLVIAVLAFSQDKNESYAPGAQVDLVYEFTGEVKAKKDSVFRVKAVIEFSKLDPECKLKVKSGEYATKDKDLKSKDFEMAKLDDGTYPELSRKNKLVTIDLGLYGPGNSYWEFYQEDKEGKKSKIKSKHQN